MMTKRGKLLLASAMLFAATCFGKEAQFPQTGNSGFRNVWEERFMNRPVVRLDDRRTHVDTWLLGGYEHRSSMLDVLLTDMIFTELDNDYIFRSQIPDFHFRNRAQELKGALLSEEEKARVKSFSKKCALGHPHGGSLNFAYLPVFMNKTTGGSQKMTEVLYRIARGDGCICDYGVSENPTPGQLLQLLNEGVPVILEKKGSSSWNLFSNDDSRWQMLFGSFSGSDNRLQFLMNVPAETTLMERFTWRGGMSDPSLESISFSTICEKNYWRSKDIGYYNIRSNIDNLICNNGFMLLPESALADYRLHAMRHWRRSVSAWDNELREILGLPKAEKKPQMGKPRREAVSRELWRYYFFENRGSAGLAFEGSAFAKLRLPVVGISRLEIAMLASVAASRPDFTAFGLSFPGRLFHTSRLFLGNTLLRPKQAELDQCIALTDRQLNHYKERFGEPPPEQYHWDDPEYSTDRMNRHHDGYKPRHSLSAHIFHSLPKILRGVTGVHEAVARLPEACAWTATIEGGPGTDWETMKLAVWRGIPIILEGADGDWRTAFGYLVHEDRKLLLVTKRLDSASLPSEPILKEYELPEKLPEELEFIEYDESQWTPWFVHHFEPTVEHLAPQILEIFKAHPEAQAIMKKDADKTATPGQ